jgi:hypothetical protein
VANARVDQASIITLGSNNPNARVDQATILTLGPPTVNARVDQAVILVLGSPVVNARVDQDAILTLGPPVVHARVDQSAIITLGTPGASILVPYTFAGLQIPAFYTLFSPGAELIPIPELETVVISGFGIGGPSSATISTDGTYAYWTPANGPLTISFTDLQPVRSVWIPNPGPYMSPVAVWASSEFHTPYKQKFGL